jgi:DNA polymerase-3 subunit beta
MKFTVARQDLHQELGLIQGVVEAKATIPILSHVLVRAIEGGGLELLATDLEIGLSTRCAAHVEVPGAAAIPAKKLYDVVRALGSSEVAFTGEPNHWLRVEGGSFKGRVVGLAAEDFPPQPRRAEGAAPVRIPLTTFQAMVARVLFAVTTENTRFSINGALLELQPDRLSLVATDGHRLAQVVRPIELPELKETITALVPRKALAELARIRPGDENDEITLTIDGNHVFFESGPRLLFSRTLEGNFPNYERVIPAENTATARLDRAALADVLARVALLTSETSRMVTFAFGKTGLTVSTSNPAMGDASEELPGEWVGEDVRIGLNYEYVLQFLQQVGTEQVEVRLKDSSTQALFAPVGDDSGSYQYVVMPMRLS